MPYNQTAIDPSKRPDFLFVPSGPRTYEVRVAVNNHISRYVKRSRATKRANGELRYPQRLHPATLCAQCRCHIFSSRHREQCDAIASIGINSTQSSWSPTPWATIPRHLHDDAAKQDFQYATEIFWPGFDAGVNTTQNRSPFISNDWVCEAVYDPVLLQSFLWAAALHMASARPNSALKLRMMVYHQKLVQSLAQAMQDTQNTVRDVVLLSILSLHPDQQMAISPSMRPMDGFDPPFQDLQHLETYSRFPYRDMHAMALMRLLATRGGLKHLRLPGLAPLLQYTDILNATMSVTAPKLDLCEVYRASLCDEPRASNFGFGPWSEDIISEGIRTLIRLGIDPVLQEICLDLRRYGGILHMYVHKQPTRTELSRLAMHRNLIQHRLLCTLNWPTILVEPTHDGTPNISFVFRDAMLTFALGVTFPVSYTPALRILVSRLRDFLHECSLDYKANIAQGFCVWICFIGALAARTCSDIELGRWFVDELRTIEILDALGNRLRRLGEFKMRTWEDIKTSLAEYIWLEEACEQSAVVLWKQVVESVGLHQPLLLHL